MKALVTGATGFTGSRVVPLLLDRGIETHCLARATSNRAALWASQVQWHEGDLGDLDSLRRALAGMDALVNIASLGFGHAPNLVGATRAAGVSRAVFVSTTAIFTSLNARSRRVRVAAEQAIADSGLAYTILRPTMIYGSARDRNMARLVRYLRRWPLIPIFGNGRSLQQPVYVGDVAGAVVDALLSERTSGASYNIPGASPLTYDEVIDTICRLLHRKVTKVHLPTRPILQGLSLAERAGLRLPVKAEQIQRLNEDKVFDYTEAADAFGYAPLTFAQGMTRQLREMGLYG
jgi:uncharacterized protein YbjT (DUF2867 family)